MLINLLSCEHCQTTYKIVKVDDFVDYKVYYTDMGGYFVVAGNQTVCMKCNSTLDLDKMIKTEDWIADMLFRVKGI